MDNYTVTSERKRLEALLDAAEVPKQQRDALEPVLDNLAWMRAKLDDTRRDMEGESVTVPYDNGGGQRGIRQNPIYKGYLDLWRGYVQGFEKLLACLPKDMQAEVKAEEMTVLDQVRMMKKERA